MCNGLNPTEEIDIRKQTWFGTKSRENDTVKSVEWWPAQVYCAVDNVKEYHLNSPDHSKFINLVR